jgi:hypothetical protein
MFKDAFVPKDKSEVINRRIDNTDPLRRTNNNTAQTTNDWATDYPFGIF